MALHKEQRGWNTTEKEAYTVVHYVHKLAHYLKNGLDFMVYTDHSALVSILRNPKDQAKLLRWSLSLLPFANRMLVQHWPGKNMPSDFVSRHPAYREEAKLQINPSQLILSPLSEEDMQGINTGKAASFVVQFNNYNVEDNLHIESKKLAQMQINDEIFGPIYKATKRGETKCTTEHVKNKSRQEKVNRLLENETFKISDKGILRRLREECGDWEAVIPEGMQMFILAATHDAPLGGHLGAEKMLPKLQGRFWWPNMKTTVEDWYKQCHLCQMTKERKRRKRGLLQSMIAFTSMDLIGPLPETSDGNKYLLVWMDHHTRWVEAMPIKNKEAITMAKAFHKNIVCRYGAPFVLMSDRGKEFLNQVFAEYNVLIGTARLYTSPYHPETDGLVE
jgi:hypothetical protein